MVRMICLDGVTHAIEVDKVEFDLVGPGRTPCSGPDDHADSEEWCPLMTFEDGSTLFLHCPPEAEQDTVSYRVRGPRPHRWNISLLPGDERVARLSWEAC